jgi:hypothetical protein
MQAAHHWDVLADFMAERVLATINDMSKPIYVETPTETASAFDHAYHSLLQSQLVKRGAVVVTKPVSDSVRLSYSTQVLAHHDRGYVAPAQGTYTALGGGVVAVGAAAESWKPAALAALPVLVAADLFSGSLAQVAPTEVIITTRVVEGMLLVYSDTQLFYYNPGDTDHYQVALRKGMTFKVVDH